MLDIQSAKLNPITLCFDSEQAEKDYRLFHALQARRQLQRFVIFICVLSIALSELIRYRMAQAHAAGLEPMFNVGSASTAVVATSLGLTGALLLATLSQRLVPHLQWITMSCYGGLLLLDQSFTIRLPFAYTLTWALVNLAIIYTALQLRFFAASAMGVVFSLVHLTTMMVVHQPWQSGVDIRLQFAINTTVLVGFNLMLMFIAHQRALNSRMAFARARQLAERSIELEEALENVKRAEAQLVENEKQASVGRLVAGILHEVNNPIGALNSATDTLTRTLRKLETAEPEQRKKAIQLGHQLLDVQSKSGRRMAELVDELRQFVSLDQQSRRTADIRIGLQTAAALVRPMLADGVEFELQLPATPVWVHCFPERLNQTFLNLLQNAASAFDDEAENKRIVCSLNVADDKALVEIADTGRGIEQQRQSSLFELGFSQRGERVKLHLGLPTSRKTIDEIGGVLTLRSRLNHGTSLRIELPLAEAPPTSLPRVAE